MNILDYIRWRGDLTFKSDPFNDVDNLVFSQMIYADFDQVLKNKDSRMTIKEVSEKYNISQDTLRYYERVKMILPVTRTPGGIWDY